MNLALLNSSEKQELETLLEERHRLACRRDFLTWCIEALAPLGQKPAAHHRLLIRELQAVADGRCDRLMIFMPPGSAKSRYATVLFSAWLLARRPNTQLIGASHTSELADDFSGKIQDFIAENNAALGYGLASKAVGRWYTTNGGAYLAAGVRAGIPGFRCDHATIDDPVRGRAAADSPADRKAVWDWYNGDLERRLTPNASVVLMMCMVGQTQVLMANGTEKNLRDVRAGDKIATYDNGFLGNSVIEYWKSQGEDFVYEVKTQSGATTKANARHPFLVERNGSLEWVRLQDLRVGNDLVRSSGDRGKVYHAARTAAKSQQKAKVIAAAITTKFVGEAGFALRQTMQEMVGPLGCVTDTVSDGLSTTRSCKPKTAYAPSVKSRRPIMCDRIGAENSASTTITPPGEYEGFSATTAISRLDMEKTRQLCSEPQNTSGFILDRVTAIVAAGRDEVFDVQVARTQNFIADGFVSHNTRWHQLDLAGQLLETEAHRWRVLNLPAEAEDNDPLGRAPGEWLWSDDAYGYGRSLAQIKQSLSERAASREWTAQYQQRPVPDTGDYFRRDWLRPVPTLPPRSSMRVFMGSDYAVTDSGGDFTSHVVLGIDTDDRLYVLDVWRQQTSSDVWIEAFCDLVILWKPMAAAEETGQIRAGIGPWLDKRCRERRAYVARHTFPTRGDKSVRAQSIRGRLALNGLYIPANAPWRADLEAELLSFPAGRFDDSVDALGLCGQLLDIMIPPAKPAPPAPLRDSWDRAFNRSQDDEESSWKVA